MIPARTALIELEAAVAALKFSEDAGPAFAGKPVFERVHIFDLRDLVKALEELFTLANRVAFLALDRIDYSTAGGSGRTSISGEINCVVLFSDRRYSDRIKAMMGDATTPGALRIQDELALHLPRELACGATLLPGTARPIGLENEQRADLTGRILFAFDLSVATGRDDATLSRRARLNR
ncbi:MAG TPA: hypothetical protein PKA41_07965 [Verrucomicrobiota bacterium]|nr:hypothetical protein [Verrucomicrobiota bacterium]